MESIRTAASGGGSLSVGRRGLTRRHFLWLASAAAASPWLGGSALGQEVTLPATPSAGLGAAGAGSAAAPISVGYVEGSEGLADVARPDWWAALRGAPAAATGLSADGGASTAGVAVGSPPVGVVPASTLLGDPRLAVVPVRLSVLGLYPQIDDVPGSTFDLLLTVHYATGDPFLPEAPFHAWGWRDDPASTSGAPLRFNVPVERESGLRLSLDVREARPLRSRPAASGARRTGRVARKVWRQETVLSVGLEADRPKLQRGVYLLALEPQTWDRGGALWPGALPSELAPSLVVAVEEAPEAEG